MTILPRDRGAAGAVPPRASMPAALARLGRHLGPRRHAQALALLCFTVLVSALELVSIGMTLPLLAALASPERLAAHPAVAPVLEFAGLGTRGEITVGITVAFAVAALLAGLGRVLLILASTRFSFAVGAELGHEIFRRTLHQPYAVHVSRNSSEVIAGITTKSDTMVYDVVVPCMMIATSSILLASVLTLLIAFDPLTATTAFGGFACLYLVIAMLGRRRLASDGELIAAGSGRVVKILQEGLGGIRDVLIDGTQRFYGRLYRDADRELRRAQGNSQFIARSPRFGIEAIGMTGIAALACSLAGDAAGITGAIPVLGTLALAAQRLLPMLQDLYWAVSTLGSARASLHDSLALLDQPLPAEADAGPAVPLPFTREIRLEHVDFRYGPGSPPVLKRFCLTIPRGARIGFVGASGSGKSTLLDIVMGLIEPTAGRLLVDGVAVTAANGRAWQAHVAHVPQSIHLADCSIAENIALGVPVEQIDRMRDAARRARIADTIEALPDGYRSLVGERGVRLSGGQRQRIGIARALYKRADLLVLDEATSALDNETERAVMETIDALGDRMTVLVVAHRLSTLRNCTEVVTLLAPGEVRVGAYGELVSHV
jgi:ATP-binding cassette, subfamily B, bacterial PglK